MNLRPVFLLSLALSLPAAAQQPTACPWAAWKSGFQGNPRAQAACLLRPVARYARLGPTTALPAFLDQHIGDKLALDRSKLRAYLAERQISEADLGGALDAPLSRAPGRLASPVARYFVIHDTSYPNFLSEPIPALVDTPDWEFNDFTLRDPARGAGPKGHVYVNRLGRSVTVHDFTVANYASKLEKDKPTLTGLFLHIELLQPRRSDPAGGKGNDGLAPEPGFTATQYERLALLYIAASVRKGTWLIPAFHAVLDTGYPNGHDDPQNFSLAAWSAAVERLAAVLE